MNEKTEIAARLREEALARFGSIKAFAEAVQKNQQYLNVYLSGINSPGPKVRSLLVKAGLDVAYIMSGRRGKEPTNETRQTNQVLQLMKEKGIRTVEELRERLDRDETIQRLLGSDVYSAFLEIATVKEKQIKYISGKKKRS
ncbi:MAG: hypothetical protein WBZ48_10740 [Bacteroidota bacterium]